MPTFVVLLVLLALAILMASVPFRTPFDVAF